MTRADRGIPSALILLFRATDRHFILQDVILAIHKAIQKLPDFDFSDPTLLTMLPFPSTLGIPTQRFKWSKQDNFYLFQYMGRSKFKDLLGRVQGDNFLEGFEHIYLCGSSGYGKSHILAALACKLIREKKRVLYIPNCAELLMDFKEVIRIGLYFACYESEPLLEEIRSALDFDDLYRIWKKQKDIYFIVDQLNALEPDSDVKKGQVTEWLKTMSRGRQYIFSAFANEQSNRVAVISCNGGMNQVCLCFNGLV
jgi:hypothetical protein